MSDTNSVKNVAEKNDKQQDRFENGEVEKLSFATRALHVGQEVDQWNSRAVMLPIVMSTTYVHTAPGEHAGFYYGRSGNPTRNSLERCLASLENAKYALTFSSGLATVANITQLLAQGDHIVAGEHLYGDTNLYFCDFGLKFGIDTSFVDFGNIDAVRKSIKPGVTKMVWFETPTNPLLNVTDIEEMCTAVRAIDSSIIIVVDNTFLSPYFQCPLSLGVDISMNSITKYINGHSDVVMGTIATNRDDLFERLKFMQKAMGSVPSPFDCFLVNRGLKTLAVRMETHQHNAMVVAKYLQTHPLVRKVIYLGLESHPQRLIIKKQCKGYGGMIAMYLHGTHATARTFLHHLKVFTLATSLGGVESLIAMPDTMTHASLPAETRAALGIDDTLFRLSVGLEAADDLIADLDQALQKANENMS